jgi:ankyrin repeat protein
MDGSSSTLEVLKFVLDIGVDASLVNAARHSLLHKAAIYGRRDVCEYLLEGRLCEEHEDAKEGGDTTTTSLSNAAFSGGYVEAAVRRRTKMPKAVGLPLGRAHVLPDLRNQTPSEMARYNGFPALAAYLRHHEDLLWHVPIVWQPPLDVLKASLENCD